MRRNFVTATIAVSATALINPFIEAEKRHFSCTNCAQAQSRDESKVVAQVFASSSGQASVGTYTANDPCEDRNVFYEEAGFRIAGVFDGHGGWNVSEFASKSLIPKLLLKLKKPAVENENLDTKFDVDTISAFHEIEESYIEGVRSAYRLGHGGVASVGSCVCLAIQKGNHLTIGNCGDCRAVLGSDISGNNIETGNKQGIVSSKYVATRLSRDHNARMPLEVLNLQEQHPDEKKEDVVRCHANNPSACYVKGRLQLTRSIGDLYLKYDEFNAGAGQPRKMGRHIPLPFTPPYVSHTPDMTHVSLDKSDRFVIVASDGLWDFLSDEEAVAVVANCIQMKKPSEAGPALVTAALEKASEECGLTLRTLQALPLGRQRRGRHDDTTAVVMYF